MNYAVILSGGIGTRMRTDGFPKQYIAVKNKPILLYTLEAFEKNSDIDKIVIVAAEEWRCRIQKWMERAEINKFDRFALPGESRQESILNGLNACMETSHTEEDRVIIHDAVRPMVSQKLISACLASLNEHEGCTPGLPVTDTVYMSLDGKSISELLDRKTLFAGQAPEAFNLWKYAEINRKATKEELALSVGTSMIAYQNGLDVALIPGEDINFKITTPADLIRFKSIVGDVE